MNDRTQSRLASVLTIIVGAWLMASPLFIAAEGVASTNVLIVGGIIALAGLVQLIWDNTLPSWISAIAAVWLVGSAFVFDASAGFAWNVVLSAIAAFALAVWDGTEISHIQHHEPHAAM